MTEPTYIVVDTETGGLSERQHALLQVSIIITDPNLRELEAFAHRIIPRPGYEVHPEAAKINGYDEALWQRTGMTWEQAEDSYCQFLRQWFPNPAKKPVAIAHNAEFDDRFVKHHMPLTHSLIMQPWHCTMKMLKARREAEAKRIRQQVVEELLARKQTDVAIEPAVKAAIQQSKIASGKNRLVDLIELSGFSTETIDTQSPAQRLAHNALHDTYACLHGLRWLKQKVEKSANTGA